VTEEPDDRHARIDLFLDTEHQGRGRGPEAIALVARKLHAGIRAGHDGTWNDGLLMDLLVGELRDSGPADDGRASRPAG